MKDRIVVIIKDQDGSIRLQEFKDRESAIDFAEICRSLGDSVEVVFGEVFIEKKEVR